MSKTELSSHPKKGALLQRWAYALGAITLTAFVAGARFEPVQAEQQARKTFQSTWDAGLPGSKGHEPGQPVGACIADFIDTSESVSTERLQKELEAFAQALESEEFGSALKQVKYNNIAMHIAFFNSNIKPITQGWYVVNGKSRFDLANMIRSAQRNSQGYTRTDQAILYGLKKLEDCQSQNPVIDIVTDGKLNFPGCTFPNVYNCLAGIPVAERARDEATTRGVAINVLAIEIAKSPGLAQWARDHLVGQPYDNQVPLQAGVRFPPSPGKVFHFYGAELLANPAQGTEAFKTYRVRKLIDEMAARPVRVLRHG